MPGPLPQTAGLAATVPPALVVSSRCHLSAVKSDSSSATPGRVAHVQAHEKRQEHRAEAAHPTSAARRVAAASREEDGKKCSSVGA